MVRIDQHTDRDFVGAMQSLLPPGQAWQWPQGGLGDAMLAGTAQEPVRVDAGIQQVIDEAIDIHRPESTSWHISEYRRIAAGVVAGVVEPERKMLRVGSRVGDRCWSAAGAWSTFPIDLVRIMDMPRPLRVGSRVGDGCWGTQSRWVMRVRYYKSVVDPEALWVALNAFHQAHVYLWFEDISGFGGAYYGPN